MLIHEKKKKENGNSHGLPSLSTSQYCNSGGSTMRFESSVRKAQRLTPWSSSVFRLVEMNLGWLQSNSDLLL
jgi:hypothetical protein